MNIIEGILARVPLTEATLKTTLPAHAVMARVENGILPAAHKRQRSIYFTFEGASEGNYFAIRGHATNPDGTDMFPAGGYIGIAFIAIPLHIETSPTFYGRAFSDNDGTIIRGHFAVPFPVIALVLVLVLLGMGWIFPGWRDGTRVFSLVLISWAIISMVEYFTERKAILDFLQGLFYDATRQ
jgi:hypothetical protein